MFTSLPRAGRGVPAAAPLSELGDVGQRFPDQAALAALRGWPPSLAPRAPTTAWGFRWACDKQLRAALIDVADDSGHGSPWAAKVDADALARTRRHPHAVRILARAWVGVIWRSWQDRTPDDPTKHQGAVKLQTT